MREIKLERHPADTALEKLGVKDWPIWSKEVAVFPWTYDTHETCYFLEGEVIVTPEDGLPVHLSKGDLVTFPAGMRCTWDIRHTVRKHYSFW